MNHLSILQRAGIASSHRRGREVLYRVEPDALATAAEWIAARAAMWDDALGSLRRHLEGDET